MRLGLESVRGTSKNYRLGVPVRHEGQKWAGFKGARVTLGAIRDPLGLPRQGVLLRFEPG